jgi:beta-glucosidase-like glycosyl hydrolase
LQANATRQQIVELQNALAIAIEEKKHQEAVAFVASLASVRKDFENGLFN